MSRQDEELLNLFPAEVTEDTPELRPDNPEIQTVVSGSKSFMVHESSINPELRPGEAYPSQKLMVPIVEMSPIILLFWAPGAGKTGAMAEVAEYYRQRYETKYIDGQMPTAINKTIVWVPNSLIKREFKYLLAFKHTKGRYLNEQILGARTEKQQKRAITISLKTWYRFQTYIGIIDKLVKKGLIDENGQILNEEGFRKEMDNKLYLLDEIHVLQQDRELGGTGKRKDVVFSVLRNIVRLCPNIKMVLSTGTPSNKEVSEVLSLLDLMNRTIIPRSFPYKGQNYTLEQMTAQDFPFEALLEILRPYVNGKVSYMVGPTTTVTANYAGPVMTLDGRDTNLHLYVTAMSPYQTYHFALEMQRDNPGDFAPTQLTVLAPGPGLPGLLPSLPSGLPPGGPSTFRPGSVLPLGGIGGQRKRDTSAAHKHEIEAAIFCYPDYDGSKTTPVVGLAAYETYIKDRPGKAKEPKEPKEPKAGKKLRAPPVPRIKNEKPPKPNFKNIWSSPVLLNLFTNNGQSRWQSPQGRAEIISRVGRYSAIFQTMLMEIEGIEDLARPEVIRFSPLYTGSGGLGCIFAFFISIENGVAPFCMALEALGYRRFEETRSVFAGVDEGTTAPVAHGSAGLRRFRQDFPADPRRYGVITSRTEDRVNDTLREIFNAPENYKGDYVRIMIISQMARLGINVFHCVQQHYAEGHWAHGVVVQAEGRPLRLDGYTEVLKHWPKTAGPFAPTVYRHVAQPLSAEELRAVGSPEAIRALEIVSLYQGEDRPLDQNGRPIQVLPAIGVLVYQRMYERLLQAEKLYRVFQVQAVDAWPNRPVIAHKFGRGTRFENQPFEPYRPKAAVVKEGDYYLKYGQSEAKLLAEGLLRQIPYGPISVLDLNREIPRGLLSGPVLPEPSFNLTAAAIEQVLRADAPLEPTEGRHMNQIYLPYAQNYANGLLYQQGDLQAPDQLLQFYRDYGIVSQILSLRKLNAVMGEDPANVLTDIRALQTAAEIRARLRPLPQEIVCRVIELVIDEAMVNRGLSGLPISFQLILRAYNNAIFVFPRQETLIANVTSQIGYGTNIVSEVAAFEENRRYHQRVFGASYSVPRSYSILSSEAHQVQAPKVVVHMLYYVTQTRQQQFGAGTEYTHPFASGKGAKRTIRISDSGTPTDPLAWPLPGRWRTFSAVDTLVYRELISQTIAAITQPYVWRPPSLGTVPSQPTYIVVSADGVIRITSPATPNSRDLACMEPNLARKLIRGSRDPELREDVIPETEETRLLRNKFLNNERVTGAEAHRAIWNAMLAANAVFYIVRWGDEEPDLICRKSS